MKKCRQVAVYNFQIVIIDNVPYFKSLVGHKNRFLVRKCGVNGCV